MRVVVIRWNRVCRIGFSCVISVNYIVCLLFVMFRMFCGLLFLFIVKVRFFDILWIGVWEFIFVFFFLVFVLFKLVCFFCVGFVFFKVGWDVLGVVRDFGLLLVVGLWLGYGLWV